MKPRFLAVAAVWLLGASAVLYAAEEDVVCRVSEHGRMEVWEEGGQRVVVAVGGVKVRYRDVIITAARMVAWIGTSAQVYAEGDVLVKRGASRLHGDRLVYDLNARRGWVLDARMRIREKRGGTTWYMGAPKVRLVENGADALDAWVSNCGFEKPHWRLRARSITFRKGRFVAAKHCTLVAGRVPLLYVPYVYRDLAHDWPWTTYRVGSDSEWGTYAFARVGFDVSSTTRLIAGADYRRYWGWGWPLIVSYRGKKLRGILDTYYTEQRVHDGTNPYEGERRYRIKLAQRMRLGGSWLLDAEVEKNSDPDFKMDYFENEARNEKEPESYLYLHHGGDLSYVSALYKRRMMDFRTVTEYVPLVDYRLQMLPLGERWGYVSLGASAGRLKKRYDERLVNAEDVDSEREVVFLEYNRFLHPLGVLDVETRLRGRANRYGRTPQGDGCTVSTATAGVSLGATLWRLYRVRRVRLRHVLVPQATFEVSGSSDDADVYVFDGLDAFPEGKVVRLSLDSRLVRVEPSLRDMLNLRVDCAYYPDEQDAVDNGVTTGRWGALTVKAEFSPVRNIGSAFQGLLNPNNGNTRQANFSILLNPTTRSEMLSTRVAGDLYISDAAFQLRNVSSSSERFFAMYTYSYLSGLGARNRWSTGVKLSDRWSLVADLEYENFFQRWTYRAVTLRRRLHMWSLDITLEDEPLRDRTTFWFALYPVGVPSAVLRFRHRREILQE